MPKEVLLVELSGFPHDDNMAKGVDAGNVPHGSIYDLISPLVAIANVRTSGQQSFATLLRQKFQQRWAREKDHAVEVRHIMIYPGVNGAEMAGDDHGFFIGADAAKAPLSWHLRPCEKAQIKSMAEAAVKNVLEGFAPLPPSSDLAKTKPDQAAGPPAPEDRGSTITNAAMILQLSEKSSKR
jgi:hypothetical protein